MKYSGNRLWHSLTHSEIRPHEAEAGEGLLAVKALYSLISLGTEKLVTTQKLNGVTYEKMKTPHQAGKFGKYFTYGYSMVGQVIDDSALAGKYVHLMHPHQEVALVKREDVSALPELKDLRVAALSSNMETAANAIWDSECSLGDKTLIIGYGTIGALTAAIIKKSAAHELYVIEKEPYRFNECKRHGFNAHTNPDELPDDFDIVFNASGHPDGLQLAIDKAGYEGKIVELSWFGLQKAALSFGEKFHYNRLKIVSSQVSNIPAQKLPRWNFARRKALVFNLLQELELSRLITREVKFSEAPAFFDELRQGKVKDIGVVINYQ